MKSNRPFSALIIALFIHVLIVGGVWFWITPKESSDETPYYKEKNFGITVSEESEFTESTEPSSVLPVHPQPTKIQKAQNTPASVETVQHPSPTVELQPITEADRDSLPFSVLHHYGEEFFNLSAGEQHYIIDNLQKIRKINEIVGTRLLRERPNDDVDPNDNNVVEFILNPDGTIRDLSLEKNRVGTPLDELTLQMINLAHPKYPKPEQPTKVRIRVYIIVK
ncbi:energy transducer TonB family protein [Sulfuricurvum sp.]|uniref:energy transducer TonB family protein n=1 Tax=Sulfuricurvum sp. TaxID=2025608 RepID=UPI003C533ACF